MNSTAFTTRTLTHFSSASSAAAESSSNRQLYNPAKLKLDIIYNNINFLSIKCIPSRGIRIPNALALTATQDRPSKPTEQVADKLKRLVLEFKSLPEPIDRVKRLLHYAARLPPHSECAREPESRVQGCSTQVWVEAEVDEVRRMRFRADSDSEIAKGFCSCLMWLLDGAEAREVLAVEARDLDDVNVGVYGKVNSRVNTWHSVLLAMQRKTQALMAEREKGMQGTNSFLDEVNG